MRVGGGTGCIWGGRSDCYASIAAGASKAREEATDYATDQLGEWSSHSSEGETDPEEEEEEEEEEAGVVDEETPSMRLRSRAATAKVWGQSPSLTPRSTSVCICRPFPVTGGRVCCM